MYCLGWFACRVGPGGTRRVAACHQPRQDTGHGRAAGAVRADNLAEERPEGQRRCVDRLAPVRPFLVEGLFEADLLTSLDAVNKRTKMRNRQLFALIFE